jgi:CheY-like chemotaxis protein
VVSIEEIALSITLPKPKDVALVIEDSQANATALIMMLKRLNFEVIDFPDGLIAWKYLQNISAPEVERLKVIFCDVMMPNMNGLELLRKVREQPNVRDIPYVFCSAVMDPKTVRETQSLSARGYLVKPVTFSVLQKKVADLFPGRT